jgi:hypothetical protein
LITDINREREGRALVIGMNKWDLKGDARGSAGKRHRKRTA